ncbi:hypothetical protein [Luteolibacter luteus]|uniref:Uncharacterized protein n=1 Tax=Luteolibacter luteus TaxID=2728835 RepID=A0A858RMS2_9BACT|nr:hypothetical protein [Luteolibacter luteus]QJE98696.1 hypothetical protein HHL09_23905 [Luteolibacter luteus]
MNKKQTLLFLGLCTAGLATGHVAKRIASSIPASDPVTKGSGSSSSGQGGSSDGPAIVSKAGIIAAARSTLRSKDTLESIRIADGPDLYARVALWMVDAGEEDIAAYWQHYRQQENCNRDINDLIFINWTRINPQGATTATKGTPDEHYAWWAWSCHEPAMALSTAIATNPDRLRNVAEGIGEFHSKWLLEHFDELPEKSRYHALSGLAKWDDCGDPLEKLDFLVKNGRGTDGGLFKVLAARDPWAAYDWLRENLPQRDHYPRSDSDLLSAFLDIAGSQRPEVLQRIIDQAPSGGMKRRMESALFESLLNTDPEAAIRQAKETKAPYILSQRLATAALHYLSSDREKAFELAKDLFEAAPNALGQSKNVKVENSTLSFGSDNTDVMNLLNAMMATDPARTVELQLPTAEASGQRVNSFSLLTSQWADSDLPAFAEWTKRQSDPVVRDYATAKIASKLRSDQNYPEAVDWIMSMSKSEEYLENAVLEWGRYDREAAGAWLEAADLPTERAEQLRKSIGIQ